MKLFITNKKFRVLVISDFIVVFGTVLFDLVSILYASTLPNPAIAVGITSVISTLPYMIDFIVGYISDKVLNKYKIMYYIRLSQFILYIVFGLVTLFQPSSTTFLIILLINLISDLLGTCNGYLNLSVLREFVNRDNFSEALALKNGGSDIARLVGKSTGTFLITLLLNNYFYFALINAFVFLLSFLLIYSKRKSMEYVSARNIEQEDVGKVINVNIKEVVKKFIVDTRENFVFLRSNSKIYGLVKVYAIMNFISSGVSTLFYMTVVSDEKLIFYSIAYTIAIAEMVEIISFIIGSIFQFSIYKNMTIRMNLIIENVLFLVNIVNIIFYKNIYVVFAINATMGYLTAISNPKSDSIIILNTSEEKQNAIFSIFGTLVTFTVPLSATIVLFFVGVFNLSISWYIVGVLGFINILLSINMR